MRLAVIADIHGNVLALDAVLADVAGRGADRIVNLGDCVSGPLWPRETCERLMSLGLATVRGNHDRWVGDGDPVAMGPSDRYALGALDEAARRWLRELPRGLTFEAEGVTVRAFHARPDDDNAYLAEDVVGGKLALVDGTIRPAAWARLRRPASFSAATATSRGFCASPRQARCWSILAVSVRLPMTTRPRRSRTCRRPARRMPATPWCRSRPVS